MKHEEIRAQISAKFEIVEMALKNGDVKFTARDRQRKYLRLWITSEAWSELPDQIPGKVDEAIERFRKQGGDWEIRMDPSLDGLKVVRKSGEETQ